jgi:hypothetical protein
MAEAATSQRGRDGSGMERQGEEVRKIEIKN